MVRLATAMLVLGLAAPAHATPIGDAHRAINTAYQSRADGYQHGRITACRRATRTTVECDVLLTDPVPVGSSCQGGTLPTPTSVAVCETPLPNAGTAVVVLRVRRGYVWRV